MGHKRHSSNKVNEGEGVLQRAVAAGELSECGMKAVIVAVDPFHDKPIDGYRGWPDLETGPSVVRHFSQSITLSNFEVGGSLMIMSEPILDQANMYLTSRRNAVFDTITPGASTDAIIAPVSLVAFTAAQAAATTLPFGGISAASAKYLSIPDEYFADGPCRLVGMGIEIRDVSALLNRQGTITVFEVPQSTADKETAFVKAQTVSGVAYAGTSVEVCRLERYPSGLPEIMMYPNSRQWEGKEGAYIVIPFTGHENPATLAEYRTPMINNTPSSPIDTPNNVNITARYLGAYASGGVANDPFVFNAHAYAPMHSRGAYITGLNPESVYTVTARFYLESFPVQSSNLQTLAQPSCPFDPKALALISLIMQQMPVGVPVRENPLGEWFWEAVSSALPTLGIVASGLFPEFSPLIGAAAAAGTSYANKQIQKRKVKKTMQGKGIPAPPLPPAIKNEVRQIVNSEQRRRGAAQTNLKAKKKGPRRRT